MRTREVRGEFPNPFPRPAKETPRTSHPLILILFQEKQKILRGKVMARVSDQIAGRYLEEATKNVHLRSCGHLRHLVASTYMLLSLFVSLIYDQCMTSG